MDGIKLNIVMNIEPIDPRDNAVHVLLALSDAYAAALYPAESNHMESVEVLAQPNVLFLGGYENGDLVACGAVKTMDDDDVYGEIKRVFVIDRFRGKGYSKQIMLRLEEHLRARQAWLYRQSTVGSTMWQAYCLHRGQRRHILPRHGPPPRRFSLSLGFSLRAGAS